MLTGFGAMMEDIDEKPAHVDLVVGKPVTISGLRAAVTTAVGLQAGSYHRQSAETGRVDGDPWLTATKATSPD
jgi:hypothetical protein